METNETPNISPCSSSCSNNSDTKKCGRGCGKLDIYDWFADIPEAPTTTDIVEVQFKNTRKAFFKNSNKLRLQKGEVVAVEASPGHDIGFVTLTGELVKLQLKKNRIDLDTYEFKKVYRKAKTTDLEKWEYAKSRESETMFRARKIAAELGLDMKIGDVEYQGDGNKAIFYYIADERVDFRQLIKVLAEQFRVRIEMRQIGARQEAGRIGGIGPCGRELCCSTWITNFVSVATSAARYQDISLNPQKLAGQCAKLKCCLNYELDAYIEAQKDFPNLTISLETKNGSFYHQKTDIFKRLMTYSSDRMVAANMVTITVDRAKEVIAMNKRGEKPELLEVKGTLLEEVQPDYENVVGQDDLTRFDKKRKRKKKRRPRKNPDQNQHQNHNQKGRPHERK